MFISDFGCFPVPALNTLWYPWPSACKHNSKIRWGDWEASVPTRGGTQEDHGFLGLAATPASNHMTFKVSETDSNESYNKQNISRVG